MTEKDKSQSTNKRRSRTVKKVTVGVSLLIVGAGIFAAVRPKPQEVEAAVVTKGELVVTVDEDGTARVRDRYVVSVPLAGNLARLSLHAGDEVKQGQVLARVLPLSAPLLDTRTRSEAEARVSAALAGLRQANAQIERAEAALDFARQESKSTEQLVGSKTLGNHELDRARLEERSRQAELTSARFSAKVASHQLAMAQSALGRFEKTTPEGEEVEQFEVTSPTTGRVLKVFQQSEGVVGAGSQLLEIGDPAALEVAVDVLTSDAVHIAPGAHVSIEQWGGEPLEGAVRLVEPSAFTRTSALGVEEQRVNAIIEINAPYEKWKLLGDGYRVEARIETYRNKDAIQIPWSALFHKEDHWGVFMIEGGIAETRKVKVGRRNETQAEILEGLSPGQKVVVHPGDNVGDGTQVAPTDAAQR